MSKKEKYKVQWIKLHINYNLQYKQLKINTEYRVYQNGVWFSHINGIFGVFTKLISFDREKYITITMSFVIICNTK